MNRNVKYRKKAGSWRAPILASKPAKVVRKRKSKGKSKGQADKVKEVVKKVVDEAILGLADL